MYSRMQFELLGHLQVDLYSESINYIICSKHVVAENKYNIAMSFNIFQFQILLWAQCIGVGGIVPPRSCKPNSKHKLFKRHCSNGENVASVSIFQFFSELHIEQEDGSTHKEYKMFRTVIFCVNLKIISYIIGTKVRIFFQLLLCYFFSY